MHDRYASIVSLARTMLTSIDPKCDETSVRTASLALVLQTLIELGVALPSPLPDARKSPSSNAVDDQARRTVAGQIASFGVEVENARGR